MALNQTNNYKITTPHAAVIIWNYNDRLGVVPTQNSTINDVDEIIISTVSCVSIQTNKSKGSPAGSFSIALAPTRDWVSLITAGSWCAILMSDQPITKDQLPSSGQSTKKSLSQFVKMIGKIETVRLSTTMNDEVLRQTMYTITGSDWGYIFNNTLYVDNLIADSNAPADQGNAIAIYLRNQLLGDGNAPQSFKVADNLDSLIGIFGTSDPTVQQVGGTINRIDKSMYDFLIPQKMTAYFNFIDANNTINPSTKVSNLLTLETGRLSAYNTYEDTNEAYGFIDPFSLQGTNSFWQILMDNSNPALNEMFNEIVWETDNDGNLGPALYLYNRIKPFSYQSQAPTTISQNGQTVTLSQGQQTLVNQIRSPFTLLYTHTIENIKVTSIDMGTNWRDKYNFIEIRPQFQDFEILQGWTAQKSQSADSNAFNREGFRPLIVGTKQFPVDPSKSGSTYNAELLTSWIALLKEWYFDTHRLLNGTLTMRGTSEYIGVGNNILFEAGLINPTMNLNNGTTTNKSTNYILAHVENVGHSFTVNSDGTRTYVTTIQFVRGITVNKSNGGYTLVGSGSLDKLASAQTESAYNNSVNTFGTSDGLSNPTRPIDPDPRKLRGD
jgi:hypothetical protein